MPYNPELFTFCLISKDTDPDPVGTGVTSNEPPLTLEFTRSSFPPDARHAISADDPRWAFRNIHVVDVRTRFDREIYDLPTPSRQL